MRSLYLFKTMSKLKILNTNAFLKPLILSKILNIFINIVREFVYNSKTTAIYIIFDFYCQFR